jgi:hypothetical protein
VDIGYGEENQRAAQELHRGEWVEGGGVSRNINASDTSDIVGEYAEADVVQVGARGRSRPSHLRCLGAHDPTGAARNPPESLDGDPDTA